MSSWIRFIAFYSFFLGVTAVHAQNSQFTLEGSYSVSSQSLTPQNVNFTINWNERGNMVEGTYSDNYFTTSVPVTGTTENFGRNFNIVLPNASQGIKSINIKTSTTGLVNASIPLSFTSRNAAGVPVDNLSFSALMTSQPMNPNAASSNSCVLGFGTLTGYCGLYAGTITENSDSGNRCDLLGSGSTRLEFALDTQINLFYNYTDSIVGLPVHKFGGLSSAPMNGNISKVARNCGSLTQTSFSSINCQTMTLTGSFLELGGTRNFTGTYTIIDETTKESCSYSLNLNRDLSY